jgi:hypothetical protein
MGTIDSKEMLEFMFGDDASNIDSMEKFKSKFNGDESVFVPVNELNDTKSDAFKRFLPKAVGQMAGRSTSVLKKRLGELEIELSPDDYKDKTVEEIIDNALTKTIQTVKSKYGEFENNLKSNSDERVRDLETKLQSTLKKYEDLNSLHSQLKQTHESEIGNHKSELQKFKRDTILNKYHNSIKWKTGLRDIERDGFFARLDKKFKIELNENGDDIDVFDRSSNARIGNPKRAGTWKTYADILEENGIEDGVWAVNDKAHNMNKNNFNTFVNPSNGQRANDVTTGESTRKRVTSRFNNQ